MNGIERILSLDALDIYCARLSYTLLHFLWQGSIGALLVWGSTRWLRRSPANARYVANVAALFLMALALPITFAIVPVPRAPLANDSGSRGLPPEEIRLGSNEPALEAPEEAARSGILPPQTETHIYETAATDRHTADAGVEAASSPALAARSEAVQDGQRGGSLDRQRQPSQSYAAKPRIWSYPTAMLYLVGAVVMMLRVLRDLWGGQRLRRESTPIDEPQLLEMARSQSRRVGLSFVPAVLCCHRIAVPVVVGVLRPVVLLPPSAIAGLSMDELETILVHELAHVRRYDLLVTLLQRLAEALLFFHPAVWYVSRQINRERERCCDDLVVSSGLPRLRYADALVRMAEIYADGPATSNPALTAGAGKGSTELKQRVLRILEPARHDTPRLRLTRSGILCLVASWLAIVLVPATPENWPIVRNATASESDAPSPDRAALLEQVRQNRFEEGSVVTLDPIHGTITGRGGRPVAGAKVYLREHPVTWQTWGRNTPSETRDLAETITDRQGRFRFENVRSQPLHTLRQMVLPVDVIVVAEGYAVAWRRLSGYGVADFQLKLGGEVHGRVVDEDREPAAGTTVRVLRFVPLTEIASMNLADRAYPRTIGNTLDLACAEFKVAATADAEGRFVLPGLPRNSGIVLEISDGRHYPEVVYTTASPDHPAWKGKAKLSAPSSTSYVVPSPYADQTVVEGEATRRARFGLRESVQVSPIEITLQRAIRLQVRVVDDATGEPIPGALLPEGPILTYPARGTTDKNGLYEYTQLEPGYLSFQVAPPAGSNWIGLRTKVVLSEDAYDAETEVRLRHGAIISGTVVDQTTGRGIGDVRLRHVAEAAPSIAASAVTDDDGRFRIVGHPGQGQVILYSAVPGYETPIRSGSIHQAPEPFKRTVHATLGEPATGVDFELVPDILFYGLTLDPQGKPIGGVKITGQIPRGSTGYGTGYVPLDLTSNDEGRYVLTGFYADVLQKRRPKIQILFQDEDRGLATRVTFAPPDDDARKIERDIRLQPAGTVKGRVVNEPTGGPIAGVQVSVYLWTGNGGRHFGGTTTGEHGYYEYRSLVPEEEHMVSIRAEGFVVSGGKAPNSGKFAVNAGETRTLSDFHMTPKAVAESTAHIPKVEAPGIDGLPPEKALELLIRSYEDDQAACREQLDATTDGNERKKIVARREPTAAYAQAFMALADENPDSDVELKSLLWVCDARVVSGADSSDLYRRKEEAARRLIAKYVDRKELVDCLTSLVYRSGRPLGTARLLMQESPHREVRGRACLLAAQFFERNLDQANRYGGTPSEEDRREAIQYYRKVISDYADLSDWRHGTIGKQAEKAVNELENLWIGKTAPDIVGEDLDGKPLRLSDYRGKIVVLTFTSQIDGWSLWPDTLAEFIEEDQVVVLGVYAGSDRDAARKKAAELGISWRIWFDGPERPGPIVSAWNNTIWPNAHILDQEGVIRYKDRGLSRLPAAIEALWPAPAE